MKVETLKKKLLKLDAGLLYVGRHTEGDAKFCVLEFDSALRGRSFSDLPINLPDLRPINDGPWSSDAARTEAMLPVMAALWNWSKWTDKRRVAWAGSVALETVRQIVSALPGLPPKISEDCRKATDLAYAAAATTAATRATAAATATAAAYATTAATRATTARAATAAAYAATTAAAYAAADAAARAAARAAAYAAATATYAARADAADALQLACKIWIEAVR